MRKFMIAALALFGFVFVGFAALQIYIINSRILPTTPTVEVKVERTSTISVPKPKRCVKADKGEGYFRATNDFFKKHGLMTICDEKYGAVNYKRIDDVTLTSRPKTGPLVIKGCVATMLGYQKYDSYAGCRIAVLDVSEVDEKIVLHTDEGDFSM